MKYYKKICDSNIDLSDNNYVQRTTVRGIIKKENEILMIYSKRYDDYTFPGGGVDEGETLEETLKRELKEEVGADEITNSSYIGLIECFHKSNYNDCSYFHQICHIFKVKCDKYSSPQLEDYEVEHGYEPCWVDIDDIIKLTSNKLENNSLSTPTVLLRELELLKLARTL